MFLSFVLHIVFATALPSMALNRPTPLKEKNHNKVRITMLTKVEKARSPKVDKADFKPRQIKEPREILKVAKVFSKPVKVPRVLPKAVEMPKPLTRQQPTVSNNTHRTIKAKTRVPQKIPLKATSSRSHFHRNSPDVKIAQVSPKIKSNLNLGKRIADRSGPQKVEIRKTNSTRLVSHASISPIRRTADKAGNSALQAPVAAIRSNAGPLLRQTDFSVKYRTPSTSDGSVHRNTRSKLIAVRNTGSGAVRVASVMPRKMASVNFDESPEKNKVAAEAIAQILDEFYLKVGKQIAFAKIYPDFARKMGYQGKALVAFKIDRDGNVLSLAVSQSSGNEILDEAALEAVKEAGPYPPIPKELNKSSLKLKIPITYALR